MKFKKIIIVVVLLLAILMVGTASAAEENVTDTADDVLGEVSLDDENIGEITDDVLGTDSSDGEVISKSAGTFSELQSLVDNTSSGKTLYLTKDYSRNDNTEIKVSKSITIDGQGHTIDGNKKGYVVFSVKNCNAVLKNINFINNAYTCIYNYNGNCSVYDSSFTDSDKINGASSIYNVNAYNCSFVDCSANFGGAIERGNAYNCSFINCLAYNEGGAIDGGNAYNCSFVDCSANFGGAIVGGNAYNCSFLDCYAEQRGGAIWYGSAYDSYFKNCTAKNNGPAIYEGTASNCKFVDCKGLQAIDSITADDIDYGSVAWIYVYGNSYAGSVSVTVNGVTKKVKLGYGNSVYFSGLNPGTYTVTASYAGNANFEAQTLTTSFKVKKRNSIDFISTQNPYAFSSNHRDYGNVVFTGENATLVIYKNVANVAGNFNVTINGVSQKVKASGSSYSVNVPLGVLKRGNYNITVSYAGSAAFKAQTMSLAFKVVKADPIKNIWVSPRNPSNGKVSFTYAPSKIFIELASTTIPSVDVKINGVSHVVNTTGIKIFAFNWGVMQPGNYNITVSCDGGADFKAQTKTLAFEVVKAKAISSIYLSPYGGYSYGTSSRTITYDGKDATLSIYFSSAGSVNKKTKYAPGKVHVTVNGASHKAYDITKSSITNIPLGILGVGTNVIKVTYSGSAYFDAQELSFTVKVNKANPIKSVEQPTSSVGYGENTTIRVNMQNNKINGNVWFTISDENKTKLITDKMIIANGVATTSISNLAMGKYYLHVYFAGNKNYNAQTIKKTFTVVKGTPIASVEVSNWAIDSDPIIKVKVNNVNGNIWFTVSDENKTKILTDKIHIEDGWAIVSVPGLNVGKYYLHIYYAGNVHYSVQTIKSSFEVTKISPELSVAKTTVDGRTVLNATVPKDARGNINFAVNGSTYKAQITKGFAVVTLPDMEPGTYDLTTSYNGNYKYLPQTKTRTITIK